MIIAIWFFCLALFLGCLIFLLFQSANNAQSKQTLRIIKEGFLEGLKGSGLHVQKSRYPVELWVWQPADYETCEDALERASWPAMDIADWMAEGLPRTPEAETNCGKHCRCELVRYNPNTKPNQPKQRPK